jgi:hypothetical protein
MPAFDENGLMFQLTTITISLRAQAGHGTAVFTVEFL